MTVAAQYETTFYRGYEIEVCSRDFLVFAPNNDVACFPTMRRARLWINRHREATGWCARTRTPQPRVGGGGTGESESRY